MGGNFDLLGDPIPENWGKRGRPPHIPTGENRCKVRLLLAFGWSNQRIAAALRITGATLRKHYFSELRHRDEARDALKASHLFMLYQAASAGNVAAIKELGQVIAADDRAVMSREFEDDASPDEKLGKKEKARRAAQDAVSDDDQWSKDLAVGSSGSLALN